MKKHRGMRAHDIVILLKIAIRRNKFWYVKDIAQELGISQSEVSESLNRSKIAGLLSEDKKQLMRQNLLDFLEHGLKYVYPIESGAIQRGMATAHSASPLNQHIQSEDYYIWPYARGEHRGQSIEPLHPNAPLACMKDPELYELLALVDAIRISRVREHQLAMEELRQRIL